MTRVGINPARGKVTSYQPARVSVCLITYIPEESGYFEHRFNVLKLVFSSIDAHTTPPYDLLVFDNHSCPAVTDYLISLKDAGLIDYLILSQRNIGKIGAFRILFEAAPGEIIAYSDDDIFFYPSWLEAHLKILENISQAGMVSGVPVRNASHHANQSLNKLRKQTDQNLRIYETRHIPDEWEIDWAVSTGRDPQTHLASTSQDQDMIIEVHNKEGETLCKAVAAANHFQFMGWKSRLLTALPEMWSGKLMGAMIELDEAIDQAGYLRLSTTERFVQHIGNTISPALLEVARNFELMDSKTGAITQIENFSKLQPARKRPWILRIPGSRRFFSWIYHRLFKVLYG